MPTAIDTHSIHSVDFDINITKIRNTPLEIETIILKNHLTLTNVINNCGSTGININMYIHINSHLFPRHRIIEKNIFIVTTSQNFVFIRTEKNLHDTGINIPFFYSSLQDGSIKAGVKKFISFFYIAKREKNDVI